MSHTPRLTVIGAGTMGHGIAQIGAMGQDQTVLYDVSSESLERALERITANLDKGIARGKLGEAEKASCLEKLRTSTDLAEAVSEADLVIEAVPENLDLKLCLIEEATQAAPDAAIFATNTSSLSVTALAARAKHPSQVVGMHFFNPPHIVKLLEIVRAEQTSPETLAKAEAAGERFGREKIVVQDSAGFASSRLGLVLGLEAMRMVEQGVARAEEIDKAMKLGYRHPMGPLELTDLVGLDVRLDIADYLYRELGGDQFRAPQILRRMVRAGHLGKKSGQGFYSWPRD